MDILFSNDRARKEFNTQKILLQRHGPKRAKIIQRRLSQLRAANILEELRNLPGRCHELRENRRHQLSLDLDHPYRLIFMPAHNPLPCKPDGGLDWAKVTSVTIIGVEDTHD